MKLKIKSKFHNVGQGLFYTSIVGNRFNFIYDCGNDTGRLPRYLRLEDESILEKNFVAYAQEVEESGQKREIELLVLSHLDRDHCSGNPPILEKFDRVRKVVLPYLSPLERLLVAVRRELNASNIRFLSDPVSLLLGSGVVEQAEVKLLLNN